MADSSCEIGSQLIDEMVAGAAGGRFLPIEQFLADHPQACDDSEVAVRLIYEDFCQRQEAGLEVDPAVTLERFPQWRSKLEIVLDCHQLMRQQEPAPRFPSGGEAFGEFLILDELGRGAEGRVFLATQPSLSDRPVVVKITPRNGSEHLSLARLQHSSIVPLYLVQDHAERNLRLLCMPYVGGISLDRMLEQLANVPLDERAGQHFAEALKQASESVAVVLPFEGPALQFLTRASYVQAACWIGACLADALQYAHGRGLLHLDVKPSNVLLAGDGQPMLLDFHLAHEMILSGGTKVEWLGGTPAYMSPEQKRAIEAIRVGRPIPATLDGRSDIYSLGLLLHELLAGCLPEQSAGAAPCRLSKTVLEFAPAAARIIRKCLAPDPGRRYADAGLLAADLRGCLMSSARRPRAGRFVRWISMVAVLPVMLVCLGAGLSEFVHRYQPSQAAAPNVPDRSAVLRRMRKANELHELVDHLRFLDGVDSLPADRARKLEAGCRAVWDARQGMIGQPGSALREKPEGQIRIDLLDLATLWANLHVRLAAGSDRDRARRDAIRVLDEAEAEFGGSVVMDRERQVYAESLGLRDEASRAARLASARQPHTAWEHYAIGRSLLRAGQPESADAEFQQAVDLDPQSFWPNFYQGICAYRLRRFEAALAAFSACVALAPNKAECFVSRALAFRALGRDDLAAHDLVTARRLDPSLRIEIPGIDARAL